MNYDIIIIGAGIVGLASALKILEKDSTLKLLILEKEYDICKHQTGNNSGVIHSGIYYKPGSLKAENCKKGYKLLLDFCNENKINYNICGKIIVATNDKQIEALDSIYERGVENGLENLEIISQNQIKEIEPFANGMKGIKVPQTGIINFTDVARKILENIKKYKGQILFNQKVIQIKQSENEIEIRTQTEVYKTKYLVSCSGLQSDNIASMTEKKLPFRIIPFRGEYYKLKDGKINLVNTLIYPVPDPAFPFLGVHFTKMINGGVEAGPNAVLSFKREGYNKFSFNLNDTFEIFTWPGFVTVAKKYWKTGFGEFYRSFNKNAFVKALQELIPIIKKEDLIKGGAGVRAQACDKNGGLIDDFYFIENKNIIHVCNAPSPAATSSLAIGEKIAEKLFNIVN